MLRFSTKTIKFHNNQPNKKFYIHNDSPKKIIYSIQTNNLNKIQVAPNCGFIRQQSRVHVEVRIKNIITTAVNTTDNNINNSNNSSPIAMHKKYTSQFSDIQSSTLNNNNILEQPLTQIIITKVQSQQHKQQKQSITIMKKKQQQGLINYNRSNKDMAINNNITTSNNNNSRRCKLRISWMQIQNKQLIQQINKGCSFIQIWQQMKDTDRYNHIIDVRFDQQEQLQQQQNQHYINNIIGSEKSPISQKNKQQQPLNNKNINNTTTYTTTKKNNTNNIITSNNNIIQLQHLLSSQRINTTKLKQKLIITEQKLKQINYQLLQMKVNTSIQIQCDQKHGTFNQLLIMGFISFICGYMYQMWIEN